MRKYLLTAGALLLVSMAWSQTKPLAGFSEAAAKDEMAKEEQFDSYLKASNVDSFMKTLSSIRTMLAVLVARRTPTSSTTSSKAGAMMYRWRPSTSYSLHPKNACWK